MKSLFLSMALIAAPALMAQPLKSASVDQLVEQLAGPATPVTRSLRNLTPAPRSIDLVIPFDFDSAKLLDSSKPLLDNLAAAMTSERLMAVRFKVEGHTDSQGTEAYNLQLSHRRADAVVNYMAEKGIEKARMEGIGKGFSELLYPGKPQATENRRVRITAQP